MSDIEIRPARAEEFAAIGEVTIMANPPGASHNPVHRSDCPNP